MDISEFIVYVLYSKKYDKIYVGFTQNLIQRFYSHNFLGKKGWTIRFRPWMVIHVEYFSTKKEAIKREKELKSAKGRSHIREQILPLYS